MKIKRIGIHGEGIGDIDGLTVFVPGALPGEEVTVEIEEARKNYARARLVSIQKKSPDRVTPPCPVFGKCGGCQLMHLSYSKQLETKRARVVDALERIGKLFDVPVHPCIPSAPLAYRNKIQLPYHSGKLGLYAFNSHDLIEIDTCYIHCPLGERAFQQIRQIVHSVKHVLIKTAVQTNQVLVILVTQDKELLTPLAQQIMESLPEIKGVVQNFNPSSSNVILGPTYVTLAGQPYIEEKISDLTFKVSPASFFQVNPIQAEHLYQKAVEFADLSGTETVLDAYCGVGTLSLILAPHARHIIGVESVPKAIEDAKANAQTNKISNVTFTCAPMEDFHPPTIDTAILNPPRKGCHPAALKHLLHLKPRRIVYISCDPATLARDLNLLHPSYTINQVQPLDMFPQTTHVESVVQLTLK